MTMAENKLLNLEAERAVLGSIFVNNSVFSKAIELLDAEDFSDSAHRIVFKIMLNLWLNDVPIDYITVSNELEKEGMFDRLGGRSFLIGLINSVTVSANLAYHAEIVRDCAVRRRINRAGREIGSLAFDNSRDTLQILNEAEKHLFEAGQDRKHRDNGHVRDIMPQVLANILDKSKLRSYITGYPTPFTALNYFTGGLQPGSLNIIAARPSMGKTALALNIAQFGGGDNNSPVLIFSLEMPADHLIQRMIAAESEVDLSRLRNGTFDANSFGDVSEACDKLAKRNIYINEATQLTGADFLAQCRRFKTQHPDLALVVVDYLQLMSSGEARHEFGRQQEVAEISRMLKVTAREIDCPVIALSQLSRNAENRTDKKPQLADLRDSGAIEQDADVVMMLFRADYYTDNENNDQRDSKADIRVAKNRNGSTGMFSLTFKREITRFLDYGEREE